MTDQKPLLAKNYELINLETSYIKWTDR